ncbi:hypothetical protein RDV84_24645 [Lysobacter yananisis]|uniref:Transposase IS204/IS1001/IS1096/IS1165 DDE domain-containing protein n=1 Tax=Lysobacter yananisis TaxID=1003114 RepID=A0ABY9P887_9GAMM|nr:hypothetical protein [Lysobacter yananisis]WMT03106.1 hypothetical protein RDV84_24645 [Lysobacter yananisis]
MAHAGAGARRERSWARKRAGDRWPPFPGALQQETRAAEASIASPDPHAASRGPAGERDDLAERPPRPARTSIRLRACARPSRLLREAGRAMPMATAKSRKFTGEFLAKPLAMLMPQGFARAIEKLSAGLSTGDVDNCNGLVKKCANSRKAAAGAGPGGGAERPPQRGCAAAAPDRRGGAAAARRLPRAARLCEAARRPPPCPSAVRA